MKMRCEAEEGTMVFVGYHQRMVALKKMLLVFLLLDWFVCLVLAFFFWSFVINILDILITVGNASSYRSSLLPLQEISL